MKIKSFKKILSEGGMKMSIEREIKNLIAKGKKKITILGAYNNDRYKIDIISLVIENEKINGVATIYANDQYYMTKSFKEILPVINKMIIKKIY